MWDLAHIGSSSNEPGLFHGWWRAEGARLAAHPRGVNAGVGWQFSVSGTIGRLHLDGYDGGLWGAYVDPTGASHKFVAQLHGDDPILTGMETGYTNDGSFLRVRRVNSTLLVDRSDGIRERFICIADCGTQKALWELDQMSDPFGHVLYVTRTTEPSAEGGGWFWTYHEAVGTTPYPDHNTAALTEIRRHEVTYYRDSTLTMGFRVGEVKLASSAGTGTARYVFGYESTGLIRPIASDYGGRDQVAGLNDGSEPPANRLQVKLLQSITQPSLAGSEAGTWSFTYVIDPRDAGYAGNECHYTDQYTWTTGEGVTTRWEAAHFSGQLASMTLPTGGKITYRYGTRGFSKRFCNTTVPGQQGSFGYIGIVVTERQVYKFNEDQGGDDLVPDGNPWLYFGAAYNHLPGTCEIREMISTTLDPLGNATSSFFSVYHDGTQNTQGWKRVEYGMPFSRFENDGAGKFLSRRVFQCEDVTDFYNRDTRSDAFRKLHARWRRNGESPICGNPVRTTYQSWEYGADACGGSAVVCDRWNDRMKGERVVYHDDANSFTETLYDEYENCPPATATAWPAFRKHLHVFR